MQSNTSSAPLSQRDIDTWKSNFQSDFESLQSHLDIFWANHDLMQFDLMVKLENERIASFVLDQDIIPFLNILAEDLISINPPTDRTFDNLQVLLAMKESKAKVMSELISEIAKVNEETRKSAHNYGEIVRCSLVLSIFDCHPMLRFPFINRVRKINMDMVNWKKPFDSTYGMDLNIRVPEILDYSVEEAISDEYEDKKEQSIEEFLDDYDGSDSSTTELVPEQLEQNPKSPDLRYTPPNTPPYRPVSPAYESPNEMNTDDEPEKKKRRKNE